MWAGRAGAERVSARGSLRFEGRFGYRASPPCSTPCASSCSVSSGSSPCPRRSRRRASPATPAPAAPLRLVVFWGSRASRHSPRVRGRGQRGGGITALTRLASVTGDDAPRRRGRPLRRLRDGQLATRDHLPALVDAVVASGVCQALVVGHRDLGSPRADVIARARALSARGIPTVLSNLRRARGAGALRRARRRGRRPRGALTPLGRRWGWCRCSPASLSRSGAIAPRASPCRRSRRPRPRRARRARGGRPLRGGLYDLEWPSTLRHGAQWVEIARAINAPTWSSPRTSTATWRRLEIERGAALRVFATEPGRVVQTTLPSPLDSPRRRYWNAGRRGARNGAFPE